MDQSDSSSREVYLPGKNSSPGDLPPEHSSQRPSQRLMRELWRFQTRGVLYARIYARSLKGDLDSRALLFEDLKGRTVSVVGNAISLGTKKFGDHIDRNDIVIRFNGAPMVSQQSHGRRTDWLAVGIPVEPEFVRARGIRRVLWMSRFRHKMKLPTLQVERLYLHPKSSILALASRANVRRPSTGLCILDLLSASDCSKVDVFGFDFYQSRSLSGLQTKESTPHDYDKEEEFVMKIISNDDRFTIWN